MGSERSENVINKDLFPIITASGTPYEIGLIHGREAKKQVEISINTYKAMFWDYSHIRWEDACSYACLLYTSSVSWEPLPIPWVWV